MSENPKSFLFPISKEQENPLLQFKKDAKYLETQIEETKLALENYDVLNLTGNDISALQHKLESQIIALDKLESIEPSIVDNIGTKIKSLRNNLVDTKKTEQVNTLESLADHQPKETVQNYESKVIERLNFDENISFNIESNKIIEQKETSCHPVKLEIRTRKHDLKGYPYKLLRFETQNGKEVSFHWDKINKDKVNQFSYFRVKYFNECYSNIDLVSLVNSNSQEFFDNFSAHINNLKSNIEILSKLIDQDSEIKGFSSYFDQIVSYLDKGQKIIDEILITENSKISHKTISIFIEGLNLIGSPAGFNDWCTKIARSSVKGNKVGEMSKPKITDSPVQANIVKVMNLHDNGNNNTAFGGFGGGKSSLGQNRKIEGTRWKDGMSGKA